MNKYLKATLGEELYHKVHASKILVVGAGGIGSELLKNLVLSGFHNIEIIDLDTIDVSNLNRQFLFRAHHVGKPKATIAKEIALTFNPNVNIIAHYGNIKSSQFGLDYFKQFSLVMNALDNVDARKHVNRLCLATETPLIESGTTGYLGQVSVIKRNETECYECTEKITQKSYPICTIRSTPDKPVHCIVWAKECYKLLFGNMEESMLWENPNGEDKSAFMDLIQRPSEGANLQEYARNVFDGLFCLEIKKKLEIKLYKGAKEKPIPLSLDDAEKIEDSTDSIESELPDRKVWSIKECAHRFMECIVKMHSMKEMKDEIGNCVFDKDDPIAMEFVTAASNLRSHIFHIPLQSQFGAKGIAGNIIPAIATTNAIIAGIQVLEAFKILKCQLENLSLVETCKYTYCSRVWDSRGVLLNPISLAPPNPKCYVCSQSILSLHIDTKTTLLQDFINKVLKKALGVNEPSISVGPCTIYEEGEDAEESLQVNLVKFLDKLPGGGIVHGSQLSIEDFSQDFNLIIAITHHNEDEFDEEQCPEKFQLGGQLQSAREDTEETMAKEVTVDENDEVTIVEDKPKKRVLEDTEANPIDKKRIKQNLQEEGENSVILLD